MKTTFYIIFSLIVISSNCLNFNEVLNQTTWTNYTSYVWKDLLNSGFKASTPPKTSQFGGRVDSFQLKSTGYFRTEKVNDAWWLVDPQGFPFYSVGITEVRNHINVKYQKPNWEDKLHPQLEEMGFNTYGAASYYYNVKKPYAFQLWFLKSFAKKLNLPNYDYYNDFFEPIFHPEWKSYCLEYMQARKYLASDPYNIGYYPDNELPYYKLSLSEATKRPQNSYPYKAALEWIQTNKISYQTINGFMKFSKEDNLKFQKYCIELYWKPVYDAIKAVDQNHMILGTKYNSYNKYIWEIVGNYVDVQSIDLYWVWNNQDDNEWNRVLKNHNSVTKQFADWSKPQKPFIVVEFYAMAYDTNLTNDEGAGWIVKTQQDRADFFQTYSLQLLQNPSCVGYHWFTLRDTGISTDGKLSTGSNKGLFTLDDQRYQILGDAMKQVNTQVYNLLDFYKRSIPNNLPLNRSYIEITGFMLIFLVLFTLIRMRFQQQKSPLLLSELQLDDIS